MSFFHYFAGCLSLVNGDDEICMEQHFTTPKSVFFLWQMGYVSETTEAIGICVWILNLAPPPPGKQGPRILHNWGGGGLRGVVRSSGCTNVTTNLHFPLS